MKKSIFTLSLICLLFTKFLYSQDTLKINYQENYPMCYKTANGELKGIEIEILNEYIKWMKEKKGISFVTTYRNDANFDSLYNFVKKSRNNVIGVGMATITEDRKKDVSFSSPYFKNISVLVTNGNAPTINNTPEGVKLLSTMNYLTIKNSTHQKYADELLKVNPAMKINIVENQQKLLESITTNKNNFGYVDIITFWYYISKTPHYIKFQKQFNKDHEFFGYFFPKNFKYESSLKEFLIVK